MDILRNIFKRVDCAGSVGTKEYHKHQLASNGKAGASQNFKVSVPFKYIPDRNHGQSSKGISMVCKSLVKKVSGKTVRASLKRSLKSYSVYLGL